MRSSSATTTTGIQFGKPVTDFTSATKGSDFALSQEDFQPFTCRVDVQTECIQMRRCALRSTTFTFPSDRMYFSGMGMTASTKGGITMLLEMKKHRVTSERHWRM